MNLLRSTRIWMLLGLMMILLVACGANLQEEIIGQWESTDESIDTVAIFDFQEDGVVTISFEGIKLEGTYTWEDADTIKITLALGETEEIVGDVKIKGNQMTITSDGDVEIFTRVE
jgi:outer membrane biogenesis lipoprotein LolB